MKIRKMYNWSGLTVTCDHCGKDIKHHYSIEGVDGVFGLDCAQSILFSDEIKNLEIKNLLKEIENLENFEPLSFLSDSDKEVSRKSNNENLDRKLKRLEEIQNEM